MYFLLSQFNFFKWKTQWRPIDEKLFQKVGWTLIENKDFNNNPFVFNYIIPKTEQELKVPLNNNSDNKEETKYEIGIVKIFNFDNNFQRMTVICKNTNEKIF